MRKAALFIGIPFFIIFFLMCEKKSNGEISDSGLKFISTELGGCNADQEFYLKKLKIAGIDTILIDIKNDSLLVFIGINYVCAPPFDTKTSIKNDSVLINIIDTCSTPAECYSKCNCYYTFNFKFDGLESKAYPYKFIYYLPYLDTIKIKSGIIENIK